MIGIQKVPSISMRGARTIIFRVSNLIISISCCLIFSQTKCTTFRHNNRNSSSTWTHFILLEDIEKVPLPFSNRMSIYRAYHLKSVFAIISTTVAKMEILRPRYEVKLLILSTGAHFRLQIPKYLSRRIFFRISKK